MRYKTEGPVDIILLDIYLFSFSHFYLSLSIPQGIEEVYNLSFEEVGYPKVWEVSKDRRQSHPTIRTIYFY